MIIANLIGWIAGSRVYRVYEEVRFSTQRSTSWARYQVEQAETWDEQFPRMDTGLETILATNDDRLDTGGQVRQAERGFAAEHPLL